MAVRITIQTGLPAFTDDLQKYLKEMKKPDNRKCLVRALTGRTRAGMLTTARSQLGAGIPTTNINRAFRSQFRGPEGIVQIVGSNRTSQILRLMTTGGTVQIPSRRMTSMVIRRNKNWSYSEIRSTIRHVKSSGVDLPTTSGKILTIGAKLGNVTPVLITGPEGTTLCTREAKEIIAFLPNSATYKKQLNFTPEVTREINEHLDEDYRRCIGRKATARLKRKYYG